MKQIPLSRGMLAIVSEEDYPRLAKFNWYARKNGRRWYACRQVRQDGKIRQLTMHGCLMKPENGDVVDHVNHNGLDNRRENLRTCKRSQNGWNMQKRSALTSSKYKGVSWRRADSRWVAQISANGKNRLVGKFETEEAAAEAYDHAARLLFGKFASLNNPGPVNT